MPSAHAFAVACSSQGEEFFYAQETMTSRRYSKDIKHEKHNN